MSFPIPNAALDDRLAFVGTSGSGKTYAASSSVERLLGRHARCVIVDPLGVWWGLRLDNDGKAASPFNVVIFGGAHGDLPLTEHAGALIGETVATMAESCIVDLSGLATKSAERRFMLAFLDAIYRKTDPGRTDPYHIVFDEADLWAPQKTSEPMLQSRMEEIVRRGRVRGFIPWLITQRPAVLSKDVLSQADGLIALKLTSSQDRDAIGAWIEGQADKTEGKAILASLPAMQQGQGVVWIPARAVLNTVQFPLKATFDSSRTPKRGEKKRSADLRPLDLGALKDKLATIEAETKANDPRALKAEVARLKAELAKKPAPTDEMPKSYRADLSAAEQRGYAAGHEQGFNAGARAMRDQYFPAWEAAKVAMGDSNKPIPKSDVKYASPMQTPVAQRIERRVPNPKVAGSTPAGRANGHDTRLTNPQAHLLKAMAWWRQMGHEQPTRAQLAAIAGWKVGGSNLRGRMAELSAAGLIQYPNANTVSLTDAGIAAAPAPDTGTTLMDSIRSMLSNPQRLLFDAMKPGVVHSRETVAGHIGWEPTGSNMRGRLAELSALELIEYPARGDVALQDWVQ